jgi:hypothetical protein
MKVALDVIARSNTEALLFGSLLPNALVSKTKVVNNEFTGANQSEDDTGIEIHTVDWSSEFDPVASNNKLINNRMTGFNHTIVDGGSETKLAANEP